MADQDNLIQEPALPETQKQLSPSPYDLYLDKFPGDRDVPKEQILTTLRSKMAPDMPVDQFNTFATQPDGFRAIENEKKRIENNLTPMQKYRKQFPQDAQIPSDQISRSVYNKLVNAKKIDPNITDYDSFKYRFDPLPAPMAATYNFAKGASDQSEANLHSFNERFWNSPRDYTKLFYDLLDKSFPEYKFGTMEPTGGPGAGTKLQKLGDQVEDWIKKNMGGDVFQNLWSQMTGFLTQQAAIEKQAAIDSQKRANEAQGLAGEVGKFVGGTGTDLILNFPITASLAGSGLGTISKLAYGTATTYMATSSYGAAIEAGQENALLSAGESAMMSPMMRYMFGSSAGRLKVGLTNAVMGAGTDQELVNILQNKDPHYLDFAMRRTADLLLGAWFGGKKETPDIRPDTQLSFMTDIPGHQTEVIEEPKQGPPPYPTRYETDLEYMRAHEAWYSGVDEEMGKAVDAMKNGNTKQAANHIDTASAMMPKEERRNLVETAISSVKDEWQHKGTIDAELFGFKPRAKRSEMGSIINPFGGREPETIGRPAIRDIFNQVTEGESHPHAFEKLEIANGGEGTIDVNDVTPGYVTSRGRFVDKKEAYQIAQKTGQLRQDRIAKEHREFLERRGFGGSLGSEDYHQGGFAINPSELLKNDRHTGLIDQWDTIFHPQSLSEQGQDVAAVVKYHNVEAQQSELLKDWMSEAIQGDASMKGDNMMVRKNIWNNFWDEDQKQMLIANDTKKPFTASQPKLQNKVSRMFEFYNLADKGMREFYAKYKIKDNDQQMQLELDDVKTPTGEDNVRNWWMYHMVKESQAEEFRRYVKTWQKDHDGKLPTLTDVLNSKYQLKSYNPEDFFQAKIWQFANTMKKIRTLQEMDELGLAIRDDSGEAQNVDRLRSVHRLDPMGRGYWIDQGADNVLRNAWDMQSLFTMPGVGFFMRPIRNMKSVGSFILTWSLFHPSHIARIAFWNALQNLTRNPGMGIHAAFNSTTFATKGFGWRGLGLEPGKGFGYRTGANPVIDYFHEKLFERDLTPSELRDVEHIKMMGLNLGLNAEREMQFTFARQLSRWLPSWRGQTSGADSAITLAARLLSSEWMQKMFFSEWIPRVKLAAALMARDDVLRQNPQLENPSSRLQLMNELSKRGEAMEARFGEMNLDNLFWQRWAKDAGTAGLLSLGWQLGALRVYGGALKDLTNNAAHMTSTLRGLKETGSAKPNGDRLAFALYYTLGYGLMNAAITYTMGGKKDLEWRDLWMPVIGKNPPGSRDPWKRASPGEFPREGYTLWQHAKMASSSPNPLVVGTEGLLKGGPSYAYNKIQPMLRTIGDMFANKTFYGERITDWQVDNLAKNSWDVLSYFLQNNIPITVKQAIQEQPGKPGINPFTQPGEFMNRIGSMDELMSTLGFPLAPKWAGRSDFENKIMSVYGSFGGTRSHQDITKANDLDIYRTALQAHDQKGMQSAEKKLEADGYTPQFIKQIGNETQKGITAAMHLFWVGGRAGKFTVEQQANMLKWATPQERQVFFKLGPKKQVKALQQYLSAHAQPGQKTTQPEGAASSP